jgi:hypothetical protein
MIHQFYKKFRVAIVTLLVFGLILSPNTTKAANNFPDPVLKIHAGFVNSIERDIILTQNEKSGEIIAYFKIGDEEPIRFGRDIDAGFDCYGAIWAVDKEAGWIAWWSYELAGGDTSTLSSFTLLADPENPLDFLQNVDSLVYEGDGRETVVVGYKDTAGETHPLLSFEEMREIDGSGSTVPKPSYVPETPSPSSPSPSVTTKPILKKYTGFVNGVERTLILENNLNAEIKSSLKIGDRTPTEVYTGEDILDGGIDLYGTVQILRTDQTVIWWSYDLTPNFYQMRLRLVPNACDPEGYMHDIESFIFSGQGEQSVIVGYKSSTGDIYPLPSFEEMKEEADEIDNTVEPWYIPKGLSLRPTAMPTKVPATPTVTPIAKPSEPPSLAPATTPTVTPTSEPSKAPTSVLPAPVIIGTEPVVTPQLSIKKSKKKGVTTYSLREGDKVAIEYSLKKGKLAWKAGKKKGSLKNVKYVVFIKKSRNLYVGDKKGRGYTISSKTGKKKLIIKKGAKKPICSGGFGVKVKRTSGGPINISNK